MEISGQIVSVYFLDEDLYNKLKNVKKNIGEELNKYLDVKSKFYQVYRRNWKSYLDSKPRDFNQEHLLSQINVQEYLWEENYAQVKEQIIIWMNTKHKRSSEIIPLTDEEIDEMIDIAKKDVNESKKLIPDIEDSIDNLLVKDVIPKIENHIRNPV